jgi:hypothetical protein
MKHGTLATLNHFGIRIRCNTVLRETDRIPGLDGPSVRRLVQMQLRPDAVRGSPLSDPAA